MVNKIDTYLSLKYDIQNNIKTYQKNQKHKFMYLLSYELNVFNIYFFYLNVSYFVLKMIE